MLTPILRRDQWTLKKVCTYSRNAPHPSYPNIVAISNFTYQALLIWPEMEINSNTFGSEEDPTCEEAPAEGIFIPCTSYSES